MSGLPKAVNVDNYKCWSGAGVLALCKLQPDDRVYTAMPLYHSAAALIGLAGVLRAGKHDNSILPLGIIRNLIPECCLSKSFFTSY